MQNFDKSLTLKKFFPVVYIFAVGSFYTRIGIRTYSASGFPLSATMVGAEPSEKRNSTVSSIWSVMSFR